MSFTINFWHTCARVFTQAAVHHLAMPASSSHAVDRASPAVWLRSVHTHDASEQARAQEGWHLQYEQISPGAFSGQLDLLQLPGLSLIHESANQSIRQQGDLSQDSCLFAFVAHPEGAHAMYAGQCAASNQVLVGNGSDLDLLCPSGFTLTGLVVDTELLLNLWQQTRTSLAPPWLHQRNVLSLPPEQCQAMQERLRHIFSEAQVANGWAEDAKAARLLDLRDQLLLAWLDLMAYPMAYPTDMPSTSSLQERKQIVDKACALMVELKEGVPLSLIDICRLVGVSHRKLSYCFQEMLGISPMRYQRTARLNRVRWSLQRAHHGESVQDIAMHWGFWHMGQFGQDYKRHFGETPSMTLRAGAEHMAIG